MELQSIDSSKYFHIFNDFVISSKLYPLLESRDKFQHINLEINSATEATDSCLFYQQGDPQTTILHDVKIDPSWGFMTANCQR